MKHSSTPPPALALALLLSAATSILLPALFHSTATAAESSAGAKVYFISPKDGDTVSSPVTVRFGLAGMGVAPAGIEMVGTGHHHLIVDVPLPNLSTTIPTDDKHLHFGGGQTQADIPLPPGKHTLQLLLGDHLHIPHQPPVMSEKITIKVK